MPTIQPQYDFDHIDRRTKKVTPALISAVCVYCASSTQCHQIYFEETRILGRVLARAGLTIYYGGGAVGLMGCLADSALADGGKVIGVLPNFMKEVEWGHKGLTALHLVNDMHERKNRMIQEADAFIALPGGCGTLEELLEVITWKRLGLHTKPIIIVNVNGYYDPLIAMLERCIAEQFMRNEHGAMWTVVHSAHEVISALHAAPQWDAAAIKFATM